MKLWNSIRQKMLEHPGQLVCEKEEKTTYAELAAFASQFARELAGLRCCAIHCQSEMMAARALLACFAAGVTAVPLSGRYGEAHCSRILEAIGPQAVITDDTGKLTVCLRPKSSYTVPPVHPALIMCTSGTTGRPKGAMLSEDNILTNVADIAAYFAMDERDTILISRPLYHCAVLTGEFLTALWKGVCIRFYSDAFNPPMMPRLIRTYGITVFCGTPTLLRLMARFVPRGGETPLKRIVISGECMDYDTGIRIAHAFPDAEIYHVYGLTEAGPRVSYLPPLLFRRYPDCVGVPLNSMALKVIGSDGQPVPQGQEGMLWVRGGSVMLGYYNAPEKTAAVLQDGWLCTGDMASINTAGLLRIRGRCDDMIIKAGMNIYPQEIEGALKADSRVDEVLAYGYTSPSGVQIGLKIAGRFLSVKEVRGLCAQLLPGYQMPARIELLPALAKNGSGKIRREIMALELEKESENSDEHREK